MATDNCSRGVHAEALPKRRHRRDEPRLSCIDQGRPATSAWGHTLIGVSYLEQARLIEWAADELNPDGQPGASEPTRNSDGW
jgi:hypothetical protein